MLGVNKFGTDGYMPLETLLNKEKDPIKTDIWAIGVITL